MRTFLENIPLKLGIIRPTPLFSGINRVEINSGWKSLLISDVLEVENNMATGGGRAYI
jgi:hypothetical protein